MDSVHSITPARADESNLQDPSSKELSIRLAAPAMASAIKFDIPDDCRDFVPFPQLPPEIRQQIWENSLITPGMHFLKIHSEETNWTQRWWARAVPMPVNPHDSDGEEEEDDPILLETKHEHVPSEIHHASLAPLYPTPQADISYYTTLNRNLAKFSVICRESAAVTERLMSGPKTLHLENGRMVSLDITSDVIYLEYLPPDAFETSCLFTKALKCAELEKIRNVAVRYCHKWHEKPTPSRCNICGQIHQTPDSIAYPDHLYRFLAQYLPNLEQFYFVDYFILRKTDDDGQEHPKTSTPPKKAKGEGSPRKFEGGNRTYYEVDQEDWNVKSKVFDTMSWLQDRFVRYAKSSRLANHKNPEAVKFSVLACEWSVGRPSEMKRAPITPIKKGRNKRGFCEDHAPRRNRRSPRKQSTPAVDNAPFEAGSIPFVFGVAGRNDFKFTFTMTR